MTTKKVLFILTSHSELGTTGQKTGWYLPEAAHPYYVLTAKGFEVDFGSPKGGLAPVSPNSTTEDLLKDELNNQFLNSHKTRHAYENTLKVSDVDPKLYSAILYVGGHGVMWDFVGDAALNRLAESIWANGGVVASVCHGAAGLLNLKAPNGHLIIKGRSVTGFSNAEEEAISLTKVMPFLVEDKLKEHGGKFSCAGTWAPHVVVDGKLVTGQNPASASGVAEEIAKLIQ